MLKSVVTAVSLEKENSSTAHCTSKQILLFAFKNVPHQTAVTAYFLREQLLLFDFSEQYGPLYQETILPESGF